MCPDDIQTHHVETCRDISMIYFDSHIVLYGRKKPWYQVHTHIFDNLKGSDIISIRAPKKFSCAPEFFV